MASIENQRIQPNGKTLSLIAGTTICQAKCPFCISKTTPFQGMGPKLEPINSEKLEKACQLAGKFGIRNAMITGKGEPTLYPEHIEKYLRTVGKYPFGSIELQTNSISFGTHPEKYDSLLKKWREMGLALIAISIVHYEYEKNKQIYTANKDYIDLPTIIGKLHDIGYQVRLSCTLIKDYIDNVAQMRKMIAFVREHEVEQLTLRRMEAVERSQNSDVSAWTKPRIVSQEVMDEMLADLDKHGTRMAEFFYGAALYKYGEDKQNVCLTTGISDNKEKEGDIRQLIFFPSGKLITDWRYSSEAENQPVNGVKI
ncbi:MAG: radical SAM protein [Candidatus Micrarchaeales archaeon]|jgi:molybdenum cofactor biosynthesis enzyme MoaA